MRCITEHYFYEAEEYAGESFSIEVRPMEIRPHEMVMELQLKAQTSYGSEDVTLLLSPAQVNQLIFTIENEQRTLAERRS